MRKNIYRLLAKTFSAIITVSLISSNLSLAVNAFEVHSGKDAIVMVSLGDSYSSGEGIEPFYGQDKDISEKANDEDWLAHRSTKSWPSLLEIPGVDGKMGDYKDLKSSECKWYFKASSGAETKHFKDKEQKKVVRKKKFNDNKEMIKYLPQQLNVFDDIKDTVDYVTLSVGGNDVGFAGIIMTCATGSTYLHPNEETKIEKKVKAVWDNFDSTRTDIKQVYNDIEDAAGSKAQIIVAGYPKLLDKGGKGALISEKEATIVNENVTKFNGKIKSIVDECKAEGKNINFVDVESEFDGHEAFSSDPWINEIIIKKADNDLNYKDKASSYSMHPTARGAQAYAKCVNAKIKEIQESQQKGTLSGKICKASDRTSPITGADVAVYKNNELYTYTQADSSGNYKLTLPSGSYQIEIVASGYIKFNAYATVTYNNNTYMETFLLVNGSEGETGIAGGNVFDGLTGRGISGVNLSIREGWNNSTIGDVVATTTTNSYGGYSVSLPLGNYTVSASKNGYISSTFNIISQKGTTGNQNGTISSAVSGDGYRIVLTWGRNPRDLDSHVEGKLSNGNNFHVFFGYKTQNDGIVELCNLDVDDTSGYGPETVTLVPTTDSAYYYYIYRYNGSGTLASSNAQIKVYKGEQLLSTFNVPTNLGSNDYWNVFAIKNDELITKNTITDYADTSYAK